MKKRLCSFVLAAILLVASVPGASASNITTPEQMYALAENEIQATMEVVMNDVYQQLDAQDALVLLDLYRQILEPEIRADVMEKYGLSAVSTETTRISGQKTYSLPYGGVITYLSEFDDYAPTEVVATYLDRDRAYDYIFLGKNDTTTDTDFVVGTIIQEAVGNIPYVSGIANILFFLESLADSSIKSSISSANGYAKVINTRSREFNTSASVVTGWSTHNTATTPSNSINHKVTYFPEYAE